MIITQSISLDFGKSVIPPTIYAKQGDTKSRYVTITPLNCETAYILETGTTAKLAVRKPDGHYLLNDVTITDGTITAELTAQALAADGTAVAEIQLYKDDKLLTSQIFYIKVDRSAVSNAIIESTDEYNALIEALSAQEQATRDAQAAASSATASAASAAGSASAASASATNAVAAKEAAEHAANEVTQFYDSTSVLIVAPPISILDNAHILASPTLSII